MDFKQVKPIHLKCPKCGHDFSCRTNRMEEQISRLKADIATIESSIRAYKLEHPNPKYRNQERQYRKMQADLGRCKAQMEHYKKARNSMKEEAERQVNQIYRSLVKLEIGAEREVQLHQEAENELVYDPYDTAIQKYNHFHGV